MKHTMKKLLCMALAIMLLVSAVPVFAAAEDIHVDFVYEQNANGSPKSWVTCNIDPATGKIYDADVSRIQAAVSGHNPAFKEWSYGGYTYARAADIQFNNLTESVNVYAVYEEATYVTVNVDYRDGRYVQKSVLVGSKLGTDVLPTKPVSNGRKFLNWTWSGSSENPTADWDAHDSFEGCTFYANWEIVGCTECGETAGHKTTCSQYEGNGSTQPTQPANPTQPTTATYVSVILSTKTSGFVAGDYINCNLVSGKITPADRNTVAAAISSKGLNIVAWKRADNGQQASSLVDFDFAGLSEPINIMPIFGASSNGGSNNNGGSSNNGSVKFPATINFRVNGKVVYQAYVTNQTQLDEAKAHVVTVVRNMGYQVTSWNGF